MVLPGIKVSSAFSVTVKDDGPRFWSRQTESLSESLDDLTMDPDFP